MARNNARERRIARERMELLLERCEEVFGEDRALAARYAGLARRIGMRYNVRVPKRWKRRVCRSCGAFLVPGENCRVRTKEGKVVVTCLECNSVRRLPFLKEKKARKGAQVSSLAGPL